MRWVIEVEDLVKEFDGRKVLHGVTFRVGRGEVFGLLGPNGAGKTTTIKILLGLLEPSRGKALVLGGRLGRSPGLRGKIGVVMESDGLSPRLTTYENLEFYSKVYGLRDAREREGRIREVLELMGLYEVWGIKVGHLSRGMRRRLALAKALIHSPEVLFLDEPTLGLDVEAQALVRSLVTRLSRGEGVTILYASHNLGEVERVCSEVALLVRGRVVAYGKVERLASELSKPLVEVRFASDSEASKAIRYLRRLDCVVRCWRNGKGVSVLMESASRISELISNLVRLGFKVTETRRVKKGLEEIYLELVKGAKVGGWGYVKGHRLEGV